MNQAPNAMKTKPVLPLLLSMSLPVMLSMLIQSLYNIVDSIWVTKLGTDALTAVSLAFPLQNAIMSVGVGMGIGIGSNISRHLGAGSREKANQAASTGVALVCLHCVLFILLGLLGTKPFLSQFTDNPQILQWSCDYSYLVLCLSFGELMQMCLEKIFQSVGKMTTTMFLMASGCLINIVLDPIFIFGWFGCPAMGVRGAAIATVVGQVTAMLLYILVYHRRDLGVTLHPRWVSFKAPVIRSLYDVGLPSALMLATPSVLTGVLNGILSSLGSIYVAVFGLYFKLQTFVNLPSNGVIQGMRPIIGYNYGAGAYPRVKQTIRASIGIVFCITIFGTILSVGFPHMILRLFDAEAELVAQAVPALRIIGLSFVLSTTAIVASGVFEALGRGTASLKLSLLRQFVIVVPLGLILSRFWGAMGIWIAFPLAEAAAWIVSLVQLHTLSRTELS